MIGRATKLLALLLLSGAILAAVLWLVGVRATARAVMQAGVAAFLAPGVLMALLLTLQAAAWRALGRPLGHRIPFRTLLEAVTVGMAGNIITPSTYLGGEPARVLYAGRRSGLSYQELAGTVLLGKYIEALSFVLFLAVATAAAAVGLRDVLFGSGNWALGAVVLAVTAAALVLLGVLWASLRRQWAPLTAVVGGLARLRIRPAAFARLRERALLMERQASRVFREEGPAVRPALGCYVGTHVAIFLKPLAFFYLGWRMGLGVAELGLIFLTCQVLLAIQLTPSGVGTLDGGLLGVLTLAQIAITGPQCAAFLLCVRFWDALVVGAGAVLAARVGGGLLMRRPRPQPADAETDAEADSRG